MLQIKDLSIQVDDQVIVRHSSFVIKQGKITAMIGESGSGKSLTLLAILGILPKEVDVSGNILFKDKSLFEMSAKEIQSFRKDEVFVIFQDAFNSFNPSMRIGKQLFTLAERGRDSGYLAFLENMSLIFKRLDLSNEVFQKYPFELSGGMLQRCMIACAIYSKPSLIIADEPTSGLDVQSQTALIEILLDMNREYETTIFLVTHDIDVVKEIADEVLVMFQGSVVESGLLETIVSHSVHPYTKRLLTSSFRMVE
ncbi:ATP-binding cassette domain-containing protein [Sporosarcina cascadiensis]|uniref:ATP-binding cassette domain-containing protein n=1 Tax=Sporosarcina cascadiensis TaxID=2660747 RepID=UPI00129AEFAB|nr:ABC transporter ATP-binding protein [Sporosarcina cascadiensis]